MILAEEKGPEIDQRRRETPTPIGGFLLSTLIFGGAVTGDVVLSILLIVAGIILTLRARP